MLRRISSNFPSFQPITFRPGFNVILAEMGPGASDRHSRNARGKTTLIQAINYCLGGSLAKSMTPLGPAGWAFSLELDLFGSTVTATRKVKGGARLSLAYPMELAGALRPYLDENATISVDDWKFLLGLGLFALDQVPEQGDRGISPRTLLSYVIRIEAAKDPLKIIPQQPAWSSREHVAYLLNLNWELVRDLSRLEEDSDTYKAIARATKKNLLPRALRPEPELMLELVEAQRDLEELSSRVNGFQVVDDPDGLISRADRVTEELKELRNDALVDRRMIELYAESIEGEQATGGEGVGEVVAGLYTEMQRAFNPEALQSFEKVEAFHQQLMGNRRRFLASELERLRDQQVQRDAKIRELTASRNSILAVLDAGGALEELSALQSECAQAAARVTEVEAALSNVRELAEAQEGIRVQKAQLRQETARDLSTNRQKLDSVATRFDGMMQDLYNVGGVLTAEVDDLGFKFSIRVSTSASGGVTRMQLLCFDLTLMAESDELHHPGFLIHDSVVFDGVDPRQVAAGLRLVNETVEGVGGQYICTMNSNDVPQAVREEDWFIQGTRRIVLDTERGGILGTSF
ncbi:MULTISPECIES: DUF2326 domain-containing protein [unclassified Streptomyces]|uniref:DUF2326 domain-containing protein n=1 Tax=unclassified Streptomyces TaxID=2593676 RepID=UPI0011CC1451|nr:MULTISPECIES: DUF2326 domain-containing protein [unclassified Streptomyces]TXS16808.1 DUF2326 domain-containing protein [Streptomyces sp. wa22]WSQ85818.1 DUF2326 domain-containing protein [Streptomyces sp. NBC_01212]